MPKMYKGKGEHCVFYSKMQRSVRDSFLCTGGKIWDPCPDYKLCRLLEIRNGEPKPYVPPESKAQKDREEDLPFSEAA